MNMKKNIFTVTALLLLAAVSFGQQDAKAKKILDQMSARYRQISAYSIEFTNSLVNEAEGVKKSFSASLTVKGNKHIMKTKDQVVYNDGKTVWTYLPEINEVTIDQYDPDDDDGFTPSSISEEYKKGYRYLWIGQDSDGGVRCDLVDLIPNDIENNQFFKIRMMISSEDQTLKKWIMYEKLGNQFVYSISKFDGPISVDDSAFKFDFSKHPEVEVIDLR